MSQGSEQIDYRETPDLTEVHAAIQRENKDPSADVTPVPLWVTVLCGVAGFLGQWFSLAVVAVMAVAVLVYASKQPRVLSYILDDDGISIDSKLYPYSQFRSFAVIEDVAWHAIDLEPTQRFMPRLTIMFDSDDFQPIVNVLSKKMIEVHRQPDWVERLTRYLKF